MPVRSGDMGLKGILAGAKFVAILTMETATVHMLGGRFHLINRFVVNPIPCKRMKLKKISFHILQTFLDSRPVLYF